MSNLTRGQLAEIDAGILPAGAMKTITFDGGIESGALSAAATLTTALTGNDNDLVFTADAAGTAGNDITVELRDPNVAGQTLGVHMEGEKSIVVLLGTSSTEEKAQGTMTSDATNPDDGGTFVVGASTYTFQSALTEGYGTGTLTLTGAIVPAAHATSEVVSSGTNVTEDDTITINTTVYRFRDTLAQAYDVKIGASAAATLDNLKAAVNASGTEGVEYFAGTVAHPTVIATTNSDTVQTFVAKVIGTTANTYATEKSAVTLTWADATLGGGTGNSDPGVANTAAGVVLGTRTYIFVQELTETSGAAAVADQVLHGGTTAIALDNLKLAINAGATAGTNYSTGTTAHDVINATTNSDTEQVVIADALGTAGNIASTTTLTNGSWGAATLEGGVDAIVNEILIGGSAAATLDNVKSATNASAGEGTTYSTGTTANATVEATTNANTTQLFVALTAGEAGNSIVFTENATHITMTGQGSGGGTLEQGTDGGEINTTASELITAIDASTVPASLVDTTLAASNDGTGLVTAMAETSLSGGSDGKVPLFTVTGGILCSLRGYVETDLTGASATLVHGVTGTTNMLITILTSTNIDKPKGIDSTGLVSRGSALAKTPLWYVQDEDIFATTATAATAAGKINYILDYIQVTPECSVI